MLSRRRLLQIGMFAALFPLRVLAQPRRVRIGMLSARALAESFYASGIVHRLGALGYKDPATMALEFRSAGAAVAEYPKLARQLAELKCDLMFAVGPEHAARHFREVAPAVPLVFLAVDYDPVEKQIVSSLARPGGNVTGVYIPQAGLATKRIEIMSEIVPSARRYLVMVDPFSSSQLGAVQKAASSRGIQLTVVEFKKPPYDFEGAFAEGRRAKVEAYIELASPVFASNARLMSELLQRHRLPGAAATAGYVEAGMLMSYGANAEKVAWRTAEMGVRVLKGAKAGDLSVEQADEFELVINSTTARSLNLRIPESVRARAIRMVQ
jgi:putative tryptophan/tyrosine transport system substrate-binding protein